MTVSSIKPVNNYVGNGSNTLFDFNFLIENPNELVVTHITADGIRTILSYGVDYSINEISNPNGSYITFPLEKSSFDVLKDGEVLSLALHLEIKQESEFHNSANLELDVLEWTFDYVIRLIQILNNELSRTLKVKEGEDTNPDELLESLNSAQKNCYIYSQNANLSYEKALAHAKISEEKAKSSEEQAKISTNQATIATNKANEAINTVSNTLNKTQITNCLLEVPEKIKYTLQNGVLTLKAGSEIVIPNGFESDGTTRKFNKVILNKDVTFAYGGKAENLVVCATASGQFFSTIMTYALSDSSEPTVGANRVIWFDATNNIVKTKTFGGSWTTGLSFPLFIVDLDLSAKVTNLKNVFNGFGFIGHHTFSYEGIKALLPNGRNADDTLNNKEVISTSTIVQNETGKASQICFFDGSRILIYGVNNYFEQDYKPTGFTGSATWLNTKENIMYSTSDGGTTWNPTGLRCYFGKLVKSGNGVITEFEPNKPVELLKKGDIEKTIIRITETYQSGTSWFDVYSNGKIRQGVALTENGTVTFLKPFSNTNYSIVSSGCIRYTSKTATAIAISDINVGNSDKPFPCYLVFEGY